MNESSSSVFQRFEVFDFDSNAQFVAGWCAISEVVDPSNADKEKMRAKAFFYSKHVEPLDISKYLAWKETQQGTDVLNPTRANAEHSKFQPRTEKVCTDNASGESVTGQHKKPHPSQNTTTVSDYREDNGSESVCQSKALDSESKPHATSSSVGEEQTQKEYDFSLMDLAEMIQNNVPIPGASQVTVEPTNLEPTPSIIPRMSKPWEMDENSQVTDLDLSSLNLCETGANAVT